MARGWRGDGEGMGRGWGEDKKIYKGGEEKNEGNAYYIRESG